MICMCRRSWLSSLPARVARSTPSKRHPPAAGLDEAQDRRARGRLAAADFAHEAQGLALADVQGDAVHRVDASHRAEQAPLDGKMLAAGCSTSRSVSPWTHHSLRQQRMRRPPPQFLEVQATWQAAELCSLLTASAAKRAPRGQLEQARHHPADPANRSRPCRALAHRGTERNSPGCTGAAGFSKRSPRAMPLPPPARRT